MTPARLAAGVLATLFCLTGHGASGADSPPRARAHAVHPVRQTVPAPVPPTENLVVHGDRRFQPAPMPNKEIHDPSESLRDPNTGAPIGKFGGAYLDANPVPGINPELKGDQSPIAVGVQR